MKKLIIAKRLCICSVAVIVAFASAANGEDNILKHSSAETEQEINEQKIDKSKEKIADLEKKQNELKSKIDKLSDDEAEQEEKEKAILEQIDTVQETIEKLDSEIMTINSDIENCSNEIDKKQENLDKERNEIEKGVMDFSKRLKAMYLNGNMSYLEHLTSSKDFYDILMWLEFIKRIAKQDRDSIDNLIEKVNQYKQQIEELNNEKSELNSKKDDLENQRKKQDEMISYLKELYSESQSMKEKFEKDKETYIANQSEYEEAERNAQDELKGLYEESRKLAEEAEKRRKEEEEKKEKEREKERERSAASSNTNNNKPSSNQYDYDEDDDYDDSNDNDDYYYDDDDNTSDNGCVVDQGNATFAWPCPGHKTVTYGYGPRWGTFHYGIDICDNSIYGTPIRAAESGYVQQVENSCPHDYGKNSSCGCGGGYGRTCVIVHNTQWMTRYGHASNIIVRNGQWVEKGQIIGYVGSTGHSTGPHLHFETIEYGNRIDPQPFLPSYTSLNYN